MDDQHNHYLNITGSVDDLYKAEYLIKENNVITSIIFFQPSLYRLVTQIQITIQEQKPDTKFIDLCSVEACCPMVGSIKLPDEDIKRLASILNKKTEKIEFNPVTDISYLL